ncbi:Uncharacterised protein [uncultured archaeon]|nr:Uncharacterised protein [uncultured archaeon]
MGNRAILIAAFLAALLLLPGCAMPQLPFALPWDKPKPPAPPASQPAGTSPEQQASGPSAEYEKLANAAPGEYLVSYNATVSDSGRAVKSFQATIYRKGDSLGRIEILTHNDEFIDEVREYGVGGGLYLCIRPKGKELKCSAEDAAAVTEEYTPEIVRAVSNASNFTVALEANQTLLGMNASCFRLDSSDGASYTHCFGANGVLLYGRDRAASGRTREMNATAFEAAVDESAFELPAAVQNTPVDPFEGIAPRSISDRISEGQFRLANQGAYPLKIYVISSGLADSVLITKGEFSMLVDAGNFQNVSAFLNSIGVKRLNVLVATRDYEGAVAGIYDLLDSYPVEELWENNVPPSSNALAASLEKARAMNITIKHPEVGEGMNFSGVEFSILNPSRQRLLGNPDTDAIVMKVSMGRFCMLLLNPTVQERESAILSTGEDLRCDVLTYFKHGEGRPEPSVLVSNVGPKDVIISVGPNSQGLPKATTLERLSISGTRVWRTDERGTIRVTNDGFSPYQIASQLKVSSGWVAYDGSPAN